MVRALALSTLVLAATLTIAAQPRSLLHIKVVVLDAGQKATPLPRHALLISDNPPTAPPRRVVTALDGTADVALTPGNYTVESDKPVVFQGKTYQWTQMVDIVAGRVPEHHCGHAAPVSSWSCLGSASGAEKR